MEASWPSFLAEPPLPCMNHTDRELMRANLRANLVEIEIHLSNQPNRCINPKPYGGVTATVIYSHYERRCSTVLSPVFVAYSVELKDSKIRCKLYGQVGDFLME
jgi:hypothetical protein